MKSLGAKSWCRAMRNAETVHRLTGRRMRVRGVWLPTPGQWFYYAMSIDRTAP